jgi:Ca-activated chloride channel family protein
MAVEHATGSDPDLALAIQTLEAGGMTNIYDGLRTAYETVAAHVDPDRQNRVILLSDGEATAGILNEGKLLEMSTQWAEAGVGLTTIGVGDQFNPVLMRRLSEVGSGSFYFLEDPRAIEEVFEEEVQAFLVPLAEDVHIELEVGDAYALRAIYGTKLFELQGNGVHIDIPTVQIAHRSSEQDPSQERRGGGGAIVAELIPRADSSTRGADTVGVLGMNYGIPGTETIGNEQLRIGSELAPGETPEDGVFSGAAVEKAFVMVNVFAGFEMAATRATWGDDRGALGVLDPLAESVETWLEDHPDTDIEDDLGYIYKFMDNLRARGAELPPPERHPPEPWPRD